MRAAGRVSLSAVETSKAKSKVGVFLRSWGQEKHDRQEESQKRRLYEL